MDECKALLEAMLLELTAIKTESESIKEGNVYILQNLIQINNALNGTSNLGGS